MADEPLVVGFEASCDETGVVRGHTMLADAVASSVDSHARFGGVGVVPPPTVDHPVGAADCHPRRDPDRD